jgi:hypothetical protein
MDSRSSRQQAGQQGSLLSRRLAPAHALLTDRDADDDSHGAVNAMQAHGR